MNQVVTHVALPLALALIMFAMGLGLTPADFVRVAKQPRDFLFGAILQLVALPAVTFLLASVWPMEPMLAVGLMVLAACPGGTTSNLLTHMSRGDVALSISLTAVISVASMLTIPAILGGALPYFLGSAAPSLPVGRTVLGIFGITTIPVIIGMAVRRWKPTMADWAEARSRPLVTVVFLVMVIGAVVSERATLLEHLDATLLAVIVLNFVMLAIAYGVARLGRLGGPQRIAITLECGLQNGALAVVIGTSMLGDTRFAVPGALYGLWMLVSGTGFAWMVGRASSLPVMGLEES